MYRGKGQGQGSTHALVFLRQGRQAQFQDAFEEPVASKHRRVRYIRRGSERRSVGAPFFEFQERFLAERAQLLLGPSAGIVEHETTRLAIELFFFEKLRDAHGFDGLASRMCEEEGQTCLLECRNAELV